MDLDKLNTTIKELEKSSHQLKGFSELFSELSSLHNGIAENNKFFGMLTEELEKVYNSIDNEVKEFNRVVKELDSSILSRLERHKSDIQVEIRNEGTQIQRGFENALNLNFNNLTNKLEDKFTGLEKKTKSNKVMIILVFILVLLNIGLVAYINFVK